ncbi:YciI family protein [Flavobacterium poyangense]|uniref:hypothetical protein n=1 Tax=Flavobacterium poyangense TaxID=2204302 RepID=UPI001421B389|nr:hypothetical protein [Flavobacterium sp. JXAS1]
MKSRLLVFIAFTVFASSQTYAQSKINVPQSNNNKMKEYSLLIRVPVTYTTEQAKTVGPKWDALLNQWKENNIYIISFPFPGEGYIVSGPDKKIVKGYIISEGLKVVSNLFIRSENMETAIELSKACPILEFGGSVEVREIPQKVVSIK